jgi:hypothetical protein
MAILSSKTSWRTKEEKSRSRSGGVLPALRICFLPAVIACKRPPDSSCPGPHPALNRLRTCSFACRIPKSRCSLAFWRPANALRQGRSWRRLSHRSNRSGASQTTCLTIRAMSALFLLRVSPRNLQRCLKSCVSGDYPKSTPPECGFHSEVLSWAGLARTALEELMGERDSYFRYVLSVYKLLILRCATHVKSAKNAYRGHNLGTRDFRRDSCRAGRTDRSVPYCAARLLLKNKTPGTWPSVRILIRVLFSGASGRALKMSRTFSRTRRRLCGNIMGNGQFNVSRELMRLWRRSMMA